MTKGIVVGLLIAIVAFGVYALWQDSKEPAEPQLKTVTELKSEVPKASLDLARSSPIAALAQAKPENYPVFLAFLDLDVGVTQPVADDYRQIFNRVAAYYGNDTKGQVVQAVFRIHEAQQYYYTLNYRESLEYLQDTVPATFDDKAGIAGSRESVRDAAENIYNYLVATYLQPQMDEIQAKQAQNQQLQQRIDKNLQAQRAAGAAANAARAQALAQRNARVQRNLDWEYNQFHSNQWNGFYNSYNGYHR